MLAHADIADLEKLSARQPDLLEALERLERALPPACPDGLEDPNEHGKMRLFQDFPFGPISF